MKPDKNAPRTPGTPLAKPAMRRSDIVRPPTVGAARPVRVLPESASGDRVAGQRLMGVKR